MNKSLYKCKVSDFSKLFENHGIIKTRKYGSYLSVGLRMLLSTFFNLGCFCSLLRGVWVSPSQTQSVRNASAQVDILYRTEGLLGPARGAEQRRWGWL